MAAVKNGPQFGGFFGGRRRVRRKFPVAGGGAGIFVAFPPLLCHENCCCAQNMSRSPSLAIKPKVPPPLMDSGHAGADR